MTGVQYLPDVMERLLACACLALDEAGRPACACGNVIGNPVQGPGQCCECSEEAIGQLTGSLERVFDADNNLLDVIRVYPCRSGVVAADVSFLLTRCYPVVNEKGEYPDLDLLAEPTDNMHQDVAILWDGLVCCAKESGFQIRMRQAIVESDPTGGCSSVVVQVAVELTKPTEQGS